MTQKLIILAIVFSVVPNNFALGEPNLKRQLVPAHTFDINSKLRTAAGQEPTLADTLLVSIWLRENNPCALCESDTEKRNKAVKAGLETMKKDGTKSQKKAAERMNSIPVDTAVAYLGAVDSARELAKSQISQNKTTFDSNYPEIYVDQLLLEKSRGDVAVMPRGATSSARQLGGVRVDSTDRNTEATMRNTEQRNLDVDNATFSWTEALKRE